MNDIIVTAQLNEEEDKGRFPLRVAFMGANADKLQHGLSSGLEALDRLRAQGNIGFAEGHGNQGLLSLPVASLGAAEALREHLGELRFWEEMAFSEYLIAREGDAAYPFTLLIPTWEEDAGTLAAHLHARRADEPELDAAVGEPRFEDGHAVFIPARDAKSAIAVIEAVAQQIESGFYKEMAGFKGTPEQEARMGMALQGDASWDITLTHVEGARQQARAAEATLRRDRGK